MTNWTRETNLLYPVVTRYTSEDGEFQITQIEADYGREWRLHQRDEESLYGWEWCQTFHRLRDAKVAVEEIKA